MSEQAFDRLRDLPRQHLEDFAIRAAMQMRMNREDARAGNYFAAVLMGFLIGAVVAAAGFTGGALLR